MPAPAELWRLSAVEIADGYARRSFTPVDVTEAVLARIAAINDAVNALVTLDGYGAREQARASSVRWREGRALSRLDGVPLTIKDNINVAGLRTTWGSRLYAQFVPPRDELPVARVRAAGMVILGKSNVPEFTVSGYTDNELFGPTRNPWNRALTPGGSSGGAVSAVACGMAPLALGTDGGGSIRRPASHAGLVGFKPSRGRVARADGLPRILLDFEVVGTIARTVADTAMLMNVIAVAHPRDPASALFAAQPWSLPAARPCRILYVPRFGNAPVDPQIAASVAQAAKRIEAMGHAVTEASVPFDADAFNAVWPVVSQAGLAALLRNVANWREGVAAPFAEMVVCGASLPAPALVDALWEIDRMRERVGETFARYDMLMTPSTAALPWPAREPYPATIDGEPVGPRGHAVFAAFVNASGCPAISVPCTPSDEGVPIGFQLVGPPGHDEELCVLAQEYERVAPWADRWPSL
jgi:aspartyl-tRNA(Asn)/glutamyl-tRNA(Gln) amidotransferase subunit A